MRKVTFLRMRERYAQTVHTFRITYVVTENGKYRSAWVCRVKRSKEASCAEKLLYSTGSGGRDGGRIMQMDTLASQLLFLDCLTMKMKYIEPIVTLVTIYQLARVEALGT